MQPNAAVTETAGGGQLPSAASLQGSRPVQTTLQFGPVDHFDAVHGLHNANVAVCLQEPRPDAKPRWTQRLLSHDSARAMLPQLCSFTDTNVYQGQNGFFLKSVTRSIRDVQVLTSCWVDLDYYNVPELRGIDASDVTNRILQEHGWLPEPTLVINSGRGCYLQWVFNGRVHTSVTQLACWDFAMLRLAVLLKPYGADASATDAARVLRVIGSTNTKSGEPVALTTNFVGRRVDFGHFTSLVRVHTKHLGLEKVARLTPRPRQTKRIPVNVEVSYRDLLLHQSRLEDYRQLARLRGGRLTDYRKRMMYWVACSLAWTCGTVEQAKREMDAFIGEHFADPRQYKVGAVESVLALMNGGNVVKLWKGEKVAWRHRARNTTIIAGLEITDTEQRLLGSIRAPALKAELQRARRLERDRQNRRQAGMVPQAEYRAKVKQRASEKASEARSLREQGHSIAEIANRLKVTARSVRGYLT